MGAGLTQPIFHGGALRGQVVFSNARYRELLSAYHKTVISAFSNVESALVAAQQTQEQQARQQEAVNRARRALSIRADANVGGHREHPDRAQHRKRFVQRAG